MVIWYIFSRSGMLCQEKSGNTGPELLLIQREILQKKKLMKPFLVPRTEVIAPSAHARVRTYPLEIDFVPKLLMCRFELTASSQSAEFTTTALAL
jgi:hypothetical protein